MGEITENGIETRVFKVPVTTSKSLTILFAISFPELDTNVFWGLSDVWRRD